MSIDRRYSVAEGTAIKAPCLVATTANITLGGLQTIDGVTVAEHDRVLVKDQTDPTLNGIYEASTGNWERTKDFDGARDIVHGTKVYVATGTHSHTEYTVTTSDPITIGTSSIVFTAASDTILAQAQAAATLATAAAAALGNAAMTFDTLTQLATATIPVGINAARVLGSLSIGDDGDAILTKVSTPAIVKPWNKPANNAWFELMGTVGTLKFFGGKSSGSTGNITANNQALADIAQWITERKEAGCATEMAIHPGVYDYDNSAFQLAQLGAKLRSIGQPRLRYHGAGNALVLDGLAATGVGDGLRAFQMIGQLTVDSVNTADDVIVVRSLHDSDLDLRCGGGNPAKAGLRMEFGVCSRIRYTCTGATKWASTSLPLYGVFATDINPPTFVGGSEVSFSTLLPVIEGPNYGVWVDYALGLQIKEGTIEGCANTALTLDYKTNECLVIGTDMEANGIDVYCLGFNNDFNSVKCGANFTFGAAGGHAAHHNKLIGGFAESVILETGASFNTVQTNYNLTGSGILSDGGTYTRTKGSIDVANGVYYSRPLATLAVGGSPYSIQNLTGDNLIITVVGGSVSVILRKPVNASAFIDTGIIAGEFLLAPGDVLKITYTVAPTVSQWGA